jgi:serine/threonine protein kinase
VKISKKRNDNTKLINAIKIHTSFDHHENIIRFLGFNYSKTTMVILLEVVDENLYNTIKMDKFCDQNIFSTFFAKTLKEIINGMV